MTAAQAGQDPAPQQPEGERVQLPHGLVAIYVLRPKPSQPEPAPWDSQEPPW